MIMRRTFTILVLFFATLAMYAYVGETFTYEGVQYTISAEDDQTGTYQIYVSHYDTATAIIPDVVPYNGQFYQMAGNPSLNSTTNFIYLQSCSLEHYSKIDYSQVQYPYTLCTFITSGKVEVDTLILPQNCPGLFISSIGDPDPQAPKGGIHRIFLSGSQQPLNFVMPNGMYFYRGGFGLELQEIDLSSYPYTSIPFTFKDCGNLQRVTLPQTVRSFRSELFWGDTSLQELTIPNDLEEIYDNAFGNLAFDSLTISDKVRLLYPGFATPWYRLRNIYVDQKNPYFSDIDGVLFTKSGRTMRHYPAGRPDTTYVIPAKVDTIGETTFALFCHHRDYMFNHIWYDDWLSYGENPSYQLEAPLYEVRMHTGVSTIAPGAFYFSSIRRLASGEKKEMNEDFSFSNVSTISALAFAGSLLDSISFPPSLNYLGAKETYRRHFYFSSDTFNQNDWWYQYMANKYDTLWDNSSHNWKNVKEEFLWTEERLHPEVHFTHSVISNVFAGCKRMQKVDLSKCRKLTCIGEGTFRNCPRLSALDLSPCDSIRHIYSYICGNDSALTYVHLPYRVDTIDKHAFYGCVSLDTFVCPAPVPIRIHYTVFYGVDKRKCTLVVPDASIPLYQNAPIWKDFYHIVGNGLKAIAVISADSTMGMVRGGAGLHVGDSTVIWAIPFEGVEFVGWSDGNTDNPRTVTVTQDSTLVAKFRYIDYAINAYPNDSTLGCVTGGGLYHLHDSIVLWAHPYEHGKFIEWSDGYKYSLRDWEVTGDTTLVAYFELFGDTTQTDTTVIRYTLTAVANDSTMGFVLGGGEYAAGEEAYLTAVPYDGYRFMSWDFTYRTEESIVFLMTPFDATVTAFFEAVNDALPATPADSSNPADPDATPYNILGQPVDETYHGIVIQGGKKRVQ